MEGPKDGKRSTRAKMAGEGLGMGRKRGGGEREGSHLETGSIGGRRKRGDFALLHNVVRVGAREASALQQVVDVALVDMLRVKKISELGQKR